MEIILENLYVYLGAVATDGKDGHGLKFAEHAKKYKKIIFFSIRFIHSIHVIKV